MEGILEIYRYKLSDAHKNIKEKNANIVTLEEQLTFVQARLFEKNKMLKQARESLGFLELQLTDVQESLLQLRNSSGKSKLRNSKIKNEIIDLQAKVQAIHTSLLEQLSIVEKADTHLAIGELN